jgi:hypothetical protein
VKAALMAPVAKYYGVKLVDKTRGEGKTWDKEADKYAAAVKAHQRMAQDIMGKKPESSDEGLDVPEDILKAMAEVKRLCDEYELSRKLASTALAEVYAKAE